MRQKAKSLTLWLLGPLMTVAMLHATGWTQASLNAEIKAKMENGKEYVTVTDSCGNRWTCVAWELAGEMKKCETKP